MFKSILTPLSGGDSDSTVLDTALTLARAFGAHIDCFHTVLDAGEAALESPPVPYLVGPALKNAMDYLQQRGQTRAAAALRHCTDFFAFHAIPFDHDAAMRDSVSAGILQAHGHAVDNLVAQARHHDVVVMGRPCNDDYLPDDMLSRILVHGGQPMLLVPEYSSDTLLDRQMICWKDTTQAARAVNAAMPLLRHAKHVILVRAAEKHEAPKASLDAALRHLAWHGITAEVVAASASGRTAMDCLSNTAVAQRIDLMIMGAYSRGATRELVFGGCTQEALSQCGLPVFIAH